MFEGIHRAGDIPTMVDEQTYPGFLSIEENFDAAVFYGLEGNLPRVFLDFREVTGRAVYVDLGYWGRREGGRFKGYHKVSVNARHPLSYYRRPQHSGDRLARFGLTIQPWHQSRTPFSEVVNGGGHILVAGMGDKGARAEGFQPEQWERWAIEQIRKYTGRTIVYRPKPSWKNARPIPGTVFSPREVPVEDVLRNCWAVVTHHSNVAVDAILAGIPAYCWGGVAAEMSRQDLSRIESPDMLGTVEVTNMDSERAEYVMGRPEDDPRHAWAADIAWTQWSVQEMHDGHCWRHLRAEGLV